MKNFKFLLMVTVLVAFSACERTELTKEIQSPPPKLKPLEVQHGMLVFNNQETFDVTVKMLDNMSTEERKAWEKNLGFKSYDRLIHEIIDAQITFDNQYENMSVEEQQKLLESGNVEQYAPLAREYEKKGTVFFTKDAEGYESMDFVFLPFSKIINTEGFYKVGKRIIQYTKNKFKAIENGDFEKIAKLQQLNKNVANESFFISNFVMAKREKFIDPDDPPGGGGNPPPIRYHSFSWSGTVKPSGTKDKKRIYIAEFFGQHGTDATHFSTEYTFYCRAQKKNIWGNFVFDNTRIWVDGHGQITDGETNPTFSYDVNDYAGSSYSETVYYKEFLKGTYPNYHYMPYVPYSFWKAERWGGPSGIWVSVTNHGTQISNY